MNVILISECGKKLRWKEKPLYAYLNTTIEYSLHNCINYAFVVEIIKRSLAINNNNNMKYRNEMMLHIWRSNVFILLMNKHWASTQFFFWIRCNWRSTLVPALDDSVESALYMYAGRIRKIQLVLRSNSTI